MAAVHGSKLFSTIPIVVVLGATGTGKSKLALQIARKFKGEIINADSMQIYRGLNIATNKVTPEEEREIPHHLLSFLEPNQTLTVYRYRDLALEVIKDIYGREKLPVIVGGTNYYIESVLFDLLIGERDVLGGGKFKLAKSELDTKTLYETLKELDPERASVLHPNDRRRIIRAIEFYERHGESLSSVVRKQNIDPKKAGVGGMLKFPNSIILWLKCDTEILNERLDKRVDAMIESGLIAELTEFYETYKTVDMSSEYEQTMDFKGLFQSIGLKEFHEYLSLDKESRESEEGIKLLGKGIELLKIANRQYAKRQYKWITSRFIKNSSRQTAPIYGLDATDLTKWDENVYAKAEEIVSAHLEGRKPSTEPLPLSDTRIGVDKTYNCEICNKIVLGNYQFQAHIKGRKHVLMVKKLKKLEQEKALKQVTEKENSV